jgi:hypothetical protein
MVGTSGQATAPFNDRRTPTLNHGKLIVWPRLGGLHHRYDRVA